MYLIVKVCELDDGIFPKEMFALDVSTMTFFYHGNYNKNELAPVPLFL